MAPVLVVFALTGCAELTGFMEQEEAMSRVNLCNEYTTWKLQQIPGAAEVITEAEKEEINNKSAPFIAYCDDNPHTTTTYTPLELQAMLNVMETEN